MFAGNGIPQLEVALFVDNQEFALISEAQNHAEVLADGVDELARIWAPHGDASIQNPVGPSHYGEPPPVLGQRNRSHGSLELDFLYH